MRNCISRFASAPLLAAAGAVLSFSVAAQQVPPPIQPPATEQLLLRVHAKGDQIYTCKADGAQFTWTLKAPDAQLFDQDGKPFQRRQSASVRLRRSTRRQRSPRAILC